MMFGKRSWLTHDVFVNPTASTRLIGTIRKSFASKNANLIQQCILELEVKLIVKIWAILLLQAIGAK